MNPERPSDDEVDWLLDRLEERFGHPGPRAETGRGGDKPAATTHLTSAA